jgi:DNA modification methylase
VTTQASPAPQAAGATLHLGGTAYCTPDLAPLLVPIDTLTPYPGNARRGDQDAITSSVRDLGVWRAHVVQESTGYVLVGNHQLRALLDLGATHAPASTRDCDDDTARAIALRDNHTSDLGGYDQTDLLALYQATDQTVGLELAGLTAGDLAALERAVAGAPTAHTNPDDAPPLPEAAPISQPGDVWRLGPHRLLVGDATESATYATLLADEQAACLWTDPPYGVGYVGKTKAELTIRNDGEDQLSALLTASLGQAVEATIPGGAVYVAAPAGVQGLAFAQVLNALGVWRQTLTWLKDVFVLGHSDYHYKHESIYFGYKPGAVGRRGRGGGGWYGDNAQTSVLEFPRPKRSTEHPTMKPVDLVAYCLRNSTRPGDLVLDPFAGSGSTLIACHQEDRTARLIELDPRYADVTCRRYQQHTGTLPVRDGIQVDFLTEAA